MRLLKAVLHGVGFVLGYGIGTLLSEAIGLSIRYSLSALLLAIFFAAAWTSWFVQGEKAARS